MAVLMVVAVTLTACTDNPFRPVTAPESATPEGNGGNAVKYGDWIYYVNGYQSTASAENTYENIDARVGVVARIKVADIESMFDVYENTTKFPTSTSRTNEIARIVAEKAEIVVPKFYYSANTTSTQINGIYIFNNRLYMLTPNDALTAGGASLTSQLVLTSFGLDGSNEQRHYVFTSNSAQVMLNEVDNKLYATYIMGTEVGCIDVAANKSIAKIEEISSPQLDVANKSVVYLNADKAICKLNAGATEGKVVVANDKDSKITFTIVGANDGYVYYTKADSSNKDLDGTHVYFKTETTDEAVALQTSAPSSNWYGYKDGIVKSFTEPKVPDVSLYGINIFASDAKTVVKKVVNPIQNDTSITFNRLEGDILYYTSDSVAYKVDLSKDDGPVAIGKSISSTSGWSVPDVVELSDKDYNYIVTLGNGSVTVKKFYADTKTDSANSVTLTIVKPTEDK